VARVVDVARAKPVGIEPPYASTVPGMRLIKRRDRPTPLSLLLDLALSVVAIYSACLLTAEVLTTDGSGASAVAAYTLAVVHGASVSIRRLAPRAAVVILLITAAVYGIGLGLPVFMLGPAVLFVAYAVGGQFSRRPAAIWLAVIEVFLVLLLRFGSSFPGWDSVVLFAGLVAGSWLLGSFARRWQTMAAENAQRAMELEEARIELARSAVAAERLRIARELHDVVAHSMSVIAMHAGAARLAVGTDPASERTALDVIESSSRGALGEMRRLVTLLRDENATELGRSPAPRLTELHTLVADVVAVGVTVDVQTEGNLNTVPPGVSLAAYRIIQEALTNIVRHAGPTRATLLVKAGTDELTIRVVNAPPSTSSERASPAGGRHGSIGMRERVAVYGGTLSAGPTADGGWLVEAQLPYVVEEP
jgi:signal transduction histidine kinase